MFAEDVPEGATLPAHSTMGRLSGMRYLPILSTRSGWCTRVEASSGM